jgi:AcrR family transcriptional regulator
MTNSTAPGEGPPRRSAEPQGAPAGESHRPRRDPVQARSAETVKKIEEAATRLLARGLCVDEITTARVAAEAGVSVGALYRFFPDKQTIVDAVAVRRLGEFRDILIEALASRLAEPDGPALLGYVIDAFVAFLDDHPDFVTIAFRGRHISARTREMQSGADAGVTVLVKQFMVEVLRLPATAELDLKLRIASEVGDRLLGMAMDQGVGEDRRQILEQMKTIISLYLFGVGGAAAPRALMDGTRPPRL